MESTILVGYVPCLSSFESFGEDFTNEMTIMIGSMIWQEQLENTKERNIETVLTKEPCIYVNAIVAKILKIELAENQKNGKVDKVDENKSNNRYRRM